MIKLPRTPQHDEGAELATAIIRYVLDSIDWKSKSLPVFPTQPQPTLDPFTLKLLRMRACGVSFKYLGRDFRLSDGVVASLMKRTDKIIFGSECEMQVVEP